MNFKTVKFYVGCFAPIAIAYASGGSAFAQTMREVAELPRDCRSLLPSSAIGTLQRWQVFVRVEHCDRMKRLRRLSEMLPTDQRPRFFEGLVPASRLPGEFATDLPVLRVVFPERSFFDTAQSDLRSDASVISSIIAESLRREPPDVAMFVAGHADSRGNDAQNEALSINRADAVARAIFALGVNNSSIWRIGFGEDMPLSSGETDTDFARNRRVEFLFSAKPEAVAMWLAGQQSGELCQSSSEVESRACRARLKFREDYIADKVDHRPHVTLTVRTSTRSPARFSPKRKSPASIRPSSPTRAQLIPTGSTRIRIDPVNSRSNPVIITL